MAGGTGGRLAALEEMFKVSHNTPSTPQRGLTGEVRERTIWGYWAQGYDAMPELFQLCVATWQRHNPHWDVRILSKSTLYEYLSEAELPNRFEQMFSHQTASDCVRLALLARYGGIYMDVSIIMCTDLDALCWDAIASGQRAAAVVFHPTYGTPKFNGEDFTESWFLATRPGNAFFLRWRDLLRELMHNRLDVDGLLEHPLYQGVDLEGIDRLNKHFTGLTFDFREYLAIHAMCHRLIETENWAQALWQDKFQRIDAAETAFRIQMQAEKNGQAGFEGLLSTDAQIHNLAEDVPLIKLTTPHYGPLLQLRRDILLDSRHVLGRWLSAPAVWVGKEAAGVRRQALGNIAGSNLRMASTRGRRGFCNATSAALCLGLSAPLARLHSGQSTLQRLQGQRMGPSMLPASSVARPVVAQLGVVSCAQVPCLLGKMRDLLWPHCDTGS
mmetsp:Transcript_35793/g.69090  ORF Transcript_35793/g.69090 Transcript_35793/m.69090 type:complete len:442 (+) Transcript_35793:203-1528(+)